MNPRRKDATTRSSLTRDYGIQPSPRRTATGQSRTLCHGPGAELTDGRIYYMFANIANLNNWRRERGFSESTTGAGAPTLILCECQTHLSSVRMRVKQEIPTI